MGGCMSKKEMRILMLGLDASGKTTILYQLQMGEVVTTIPTIGFNVETVNHKKIKFTVWDVGGQEKLRPLWRHYYVGTNAVIFVIDSNDPNRIASAKGYQERTVKDELYLLLQDENLKKATLLIFCNKQDLPNALSVEEIEKRLELKKITTHTWKAYGVIGTTGEGLQEGLDWLHESLEQKKR